MSETREVCAFCSEETGRAGKLDDSLYVDDIGPHCEDCYPDAGIEELVATNSQLRNQVAKLEIERLDLGRQIAALRERERETDDLREKLARFVDGAR